MWGTSVWESVYFTENNLRLVRKKCKKLPLWCSYFFIKHWRSLNEKLRSDIRLLPRRSNWLFPRNQHKRRGLGLFAPWLTQKLHWPKAGQVQWSWFMLTKLTKDWFAKAECVCVILQWIKLKNWFYSWRFLLVILFEE